jgi:hypothetical protein
MIRRQPVRREIRISSRPRWILIGVIVLAPIVTTADFVSLSASARSVTLAFSEHFAAETRTVAMSDRPEDEAGRSSRGTQWTFLRDVSAKAASLMHMQTAISAPNVVGPSGALRH